MRRILTGLFWFWGIVGFFVTFTYLLGLPNNVGVGTSAYLAAVILMWIGGMFMFGVGALITDRRETLTALLLSMIAAWHMMPPPALAQEPIPRVKAVDLFVDLDKYVGKQVALIDGTVNTMSTSFGAIVSGGVRFYLSLEDIDRESLRFLLSNCTGISRTEVCKIPLLVTPTGQRSGSDSPIVKSVKIIR